MARKRSAAGRRIPWRQGVLNPPLFELHRPQTGPPADFRDLHAQHALDRDVLEAPGQALAECCLERGKRQLVDADRAREGVPRELAYCRHALWAAREDDACLRAAQELVSRERDNVRE